MASEPVAPSNALFGADGTGLPDPLPVLPDPLTGPELDTWRDTPDLPPVPPPPVPDTSVLREAIAAVLDDEPARPAGVAAPPHSPDAFPHRRPVPQAVRRPPLHGPAGSVPHRPPVSAPPHAFQPVPPVDLRRRVGRDRLQTRSNGGARTGCAIALIIFGVVAFNIITQIVESVSALFR